MKTTREKVIEQIKLQEEIQSLANINIVNCGNCGAVVLHRRIVMDVDNWEEGVDDIVCPYCDFTSEPCDFPDFLYYGMENSAEFEPEVYVDEGHVDGTKHYSLDEALREIRRVLKDDIEIRNGLNVEDFSISKLLEIGANHYNIYKL